MSEDSYKLKYIKYKKKYSELKKLINNKDSFSNSIIILPREYLVLNFEQKSKFQVYETDSKNNPISYIKSGYLESLLGGNDEETKTNDLLGNTTTSVGEEEVILEKKIISPDEYFILSDSNKAKYEINESDYDKFPNRVVPKNYKKIN
jgi:hypothetical protein